MGLSKFNSYGFLFRYNFCDNDTCNLSFYWATSSTVWHKSLLMFLRHRSCRLTLSYFVSWRQHAQMLSQFSVPKNGIKQAHILSAVASETDTQRRVRTRQAYAIFPSPTIFALGNFLNLIWDMDFVIPKGYLVQVLAHFAFECLWTPPFLSIC